MSGIRIKAKTRIGDEAMRRIIAADNEKNDHLWKQFFKEKTESEAPLVIVIEHKNFAARGMVGAEHLAALARDQLNKQKAIEGVDYEVVRL